MLWVRTALLALGHRVISIHAIDELKHADDVCDLILFGHKSAGLCVHDVAEAGRDHKSVWIQWYFDLIQTDPSVALDDQPYYKAHERMLRVMDLVFVKERNLIPELRERGIEADYLDQGCPSHFAECRHTDYPEFDVLIFGSLNDRYQQRRDDVQALVKAGLRVAWAGDQVASQKGVTRLPWHPPDALPELMGRAAITLCVDARHDIEGYWSDRIWLAMVAGACVLKRGTPGDIPTGYFCYRNTDELVSMALKLCDDPTLRRMTGNAGRERAMQNTYEHRIREILIYAKRLRELRETVGSTRADLLAL